MLIGQLEGHRRAVTALDSFEQSKGKVLLASGGWDGSVMVFDVGRAAVDVSYSGGNESVGTVAFGSSSYCIYAASGPDVSTLDIRCKDRVSVLFSAPDDVNSVQPQGSGSYISVVDDSGITAILDIRKPGSTVFKSWLAHDNICMATAFFGGTANIWEVWTGGFDYLVKRWDFSNGACVDTISMTSDLPNATSEGGAPNINPPFVYSLSASLVMPILASGLGNGSIGFIGKPEKKEGASKKGKKKRKSGNATLNTMMAVHSWSCTSVQFISASAAKHQNEVASNFDVLLSGGLDGYLSKIGIDTPANNENNLSCTIMEKHLIGRKIDSLSCLSRREDNTENYLVALAGCPLEGNTQKSHVIDLWII